MSGPTGAEVQRAIDFLSCPDAAQLHQCPFPPQFDYESIARRGSELGHDLSAEGVREAFRYIIRARLLGNRRSCRNDGSRR